MSDPSDVEARKEKASASAASLLRRFWPWVRPHRRWVFLGLSMIPIVAATTTIRPLLVKEAVDVAIPAKMATDLRWLALGYFVAVVLEFSAQAVQIYALQRGGHCTIGDLRRDIFRHVLRLPSKFYDRHPVGSLLTRTTSDVEALSETLSFGVFTILTDVVMIAAILVAMFSLSATMTLVSLSIAPLLYLIVRYFSRVLRRLQLEVRKALSVRSGYLTEQLGGITVVQLFGREQAARDTYAGLGDRYLRATKTANVYDALLFSVMDGISAFCIALLLFFGAPKVLGVEGAQAISLGLLFAFVDYLQRIFVPIREFSSKLATIQRAAASLERVFGLLDEKAEERAAADADDPLAAWDGGLEIRDLRFGYTEGKDVLKGLSFDVEPGEVVAVVGRTGSGKSSLGRVLTRLYEGYRGSVVLTCGERRVELRDVPPDQLRRHLLMVQQDVFLFDDDVRFNVTLGEAIDDARIEEGLATVQASELVAARGGLELGVGERGRGLSAGEAQLLAFARVAVREPQLLILDEATASVDSLTEQKVQAAIERLLEGRSVLVIAHRLSTIRHADKILVLGGGEILELGNHDELMGRGGVYAELVRAGFAEEEAS